MQTHLIAYQLLGNDSIAQPKPGKARILRKAVHFYGTGSGTPALIDTVRDILLGNICLIGRIIQNHGTVFIGIIHPLLQCLLTNCHTCRIVGEA